MSSDFEKLKIEVAKPLYTGMSDAAIASVLNTADIVVQGKIDPDDLLVYLHEQNVAAGLMSRRNGVANADKVVANFLDRANIKKPINPQHPVFQTGLNLLDTATGDGTFTNTQRITIETMGDTMTSIGKQLGYSYVWPRDVQKARTV